MAILWTPARLSKEPRPERKRSAGVSPAPRSGPKEICRPEAGATIFGQSRAPQIMLLLLLLLASPRRLAAQNELPNPPRTPQLRSQFAFSPPGARALGMGATFIGIADDATASESNPAGLVILNKPEVSAHFRYSSLSNDFPNATLGGIESFRDVTNSPSFFSFVYPWSHAVFSAYYQQQANFKSHSAFVDKLKGFETPTNIDFSESHVVLHNIGISAARRIGKYVSVGGSLRSPYEKVMTCAGQKL